MTVSLYIHTYTRFSDYFSFVVVQSLSCVWLLVTPWFPCPSLSPRVCSHSCPLSQWCRLAISSSATVLCPLVFPISGSFSMSWLFASGSHTLCSFSFSISPSSEYSGLISFRIDWFDLLTVQGISRVFSNTTIQKDQFFGAQPSLCSNSHICMWLLEKP